jgi:hypothetical protein
VSPGKEKVQIISLQPAQDISISVRSSQGSLPPDKQDRRSEVLRNASHPSV